MESMSCEPSVIQKNVTNPSKSRTSEDVLNLAEHAKLDPDDLIPFTQTLQFSNDYGKEDQLKLLEVNAELLELLNCGERFTIRGDPDDPSVLCTNSKTYDLREAETSNSLLMVPDLLIPKDGKETHTISNKEVISIHYKYYELKQCQPRLAKLIRILEEKSYKGKGSTDFGYTWRDLLNQVQSSEEELQEGLTNLKAYIIEDHWCCLDFDYHFGVLSSILNLIDSNSLSLNAIDKKEVLSQLKDLEPEFILEQCFQFFFSPVEENSESSLYKIKDADVSRFCAEVLLKPAGKFNLHEFLNIWQQSVPEGVETHLSQLKGVALVDSTSSPPVIWHFPISLIPLDSTQAFSFLFETRSKWTLEDISPYLLEFTSPTVKVGTLLTKYARGSTENGVKYFTSRHAT